MKKNIQKFIIIFLVFSLIFTSFAFLFSAQTSKVFAQAGGSLICDQPIAIGSALDATLEATDVLFKETQNIHWEISGQIEAANTALTLIGKDAANCDTSSSTCKGLCVNSQVKVWVKATFLWFIPVAKGSICFPLCGSRQACLGKPCPALDTEVSLVEDSLGRIEDSIQKINDVFSSSTEPIEEDIITEEESLEFKQCLLKASDWGIVTYSEVENCIEELGAMTKFELAERKLAKARADFDEWRMSAEEWEKAQQGKALAKITMKCSEALENRFYWPREWWTEGDCGKDCQENPYQGKCQKCLCLDCDSVCKPDANLEICQECLDQGPIHQYSWVKAAGCKLYGACKNKCEEGKGSQGECLDCLCGGIPAGKKCLTEGGSDEECRAMNCEKWLCGGSLLNWIGCK